MKKIICIICVFMVIIGVCLFTGYCESHYTINGVIIDTTKGGYLVETNCGNVWAIESNEPVKIGQRVKLHNFTNHTTTNEDDTTESVEVIE